APRRRLRGRQRAREAVTDLQPARLPPAHPMKRATRLNGNRLFVAHMQKTAGTSLRDRLRATFDDEEIYPNASDGPDARISVISVRHLQERWAARGDEIQLLTGHFPVRTT